MAFGIATLSFRVAAQSNESAAMGQALAPWQGDTPELVLKDLQGVRHSLSEFRGQVALVHFWASWCEACRDEFPQLLAIARIHAPQGLQLVTVNVGESRAGIAHFVEQVPIAGLLLEDRDSTSCAAWRAGTLPASYLVGRDGRMHYWHLGALDWNDQNSLGIIQTLLAAPASSGGRQQESNLPGNG